jgi:hypothetical protein
MRTMVEPETKEPTLIRNNNGQKILGLRHVDFITRYNKNESDKILKHWENYFVSENVPCYVTQDGNKQILWSEDKAIRKGQLVDLLNKHQKVEN